MKNKIWQLLTIIIIITLHLKVFMVTEGFGLALGYILIPLWFFLTFKVTAISSNEKELGLMLLLIIFPFVFSDIYNWSEFFKTYFQFIIAYFFVIRVLHKKVRIKTRVFDKTLLFSQVIILVSVFMQYVAVNYLNLTSFYNIFGDLQLYYQRELSLDRMKSFYLEPSYLAFVVINIYWARYYISKSFKILNKNLFLTIVVLFFAKSAFGFFALFLIVLFEMYSKAKSRAFEFFVFLMLLFVSLIYFYFDVLINLFRLDELSFKTDELSSGFMRVVLPIQTLYEMIFVEGNIFGLTFGQLDTYIENKFLQYGETGISNSFFLIIGYFGILGLIFHFITLLKFFSTKKKVTKAFIILLLINLNNSGAFVTLQFVFVALLIPLISIKIYEQNSVYNYRRKK